METTTEVAAGKHHMNKPLGFLAMIISATGMGLVGFLGRGSTNYHDVIVDGVKQWKECTPEQLADTANTCKEIMVDAAGNLVEAGGQAYKNAEGLVAKVLFEDGAPAAQQVKYIIGDLLAFGRMTVGMLGFLVILLITKKLGQLRTTKLSFAVVAGGLSIGASLALYVTSTLLTSIANAVFLIYTGPLFSAILARIFLKEKIAIRNILFLILVFIGMLMTIEIISFVPGQGLSFGLDLSGNSDQFPMKFVGDMFGLLSGFFYGLALFFYRYRGDIDSEVRGFWNFTFGAVAALIVFAIRYSTLNQDTFFNAELTGKNYIYQACLFIVCGFIAIGFLVVAGKNLRAVELSCVSYWECAVAVLFGTLFFGESMTFNGAMGGLLIVIGGMAPIVVELIIKPKKKAELAEQAAKS